MTQQLLVEKQLNFQEIVPLWFDYLTTGTPSVDYIRIMARQFCVVGEAHKFNDSYGHKCKECHTFSNEFVDIYNYGPWTTETLNDNDTVKEFVNHWNKMHVE